MHIVDGFSSRLNIVEERSREAEGVSSEFIQNATEKMENMKKRLRGTRGYNERIQSVSGISEEESGKNLFGNGHKH